ncbi:hypothetical protein [Flavobacterium faecale]|uniref:hypothetical protein n=1 Tax=Flavobacterium faecale TaxID=1355330 RepID=UPI003AADCF6D
MKKINKIIVALFLVTISSSCSLPLQDPFEFEAEDYIKEEPFKDVTAWEFIQTRTSLRDPDNTFVLRSNANDTNALNATGDNLDIFIAAIKKLGMESYYNQTSTTKRTYLLLNNNAFTGNGSRDALRVITGVTTADNSRINPDTIFDSFTPEQLNQLRAFLLYNIIDDYVTLLTVPKVIDVFVYPTLLPAINVDENGVPTTGLSGLKAQMGINRLVGATRENLNINPVGSPLPSSADIGNVAMRRYHYVFKNGVGHFVNDMRWFQPYSLYANITVN